MSDAAGPVQRHREPTHPGAVLREDVLAPMAMSVTEAAKRLGVTRKTLSALLNERAGVSPSMAMRIGLATNTTPESWLRMQSAYDLWHARTGDLHVRSLDDRNVG
jgi:addiction module HigA family antidote